MTANDAVDRINELERLEAMATLAAMARDLARDRDAFIAGAHLVVTRGHREECAGYIRILGHKCTCGFDELREALKAVTP